MARHGQRQFSDDDGGTAVAEPTQAQNSDASIAKAMSDPDLDSKFKDIMGEGSQPDGDSTPTRAQRQRQSEELESLSSLEDADELEDLHGEIEKDGKDDNPVDSDSTPDSTEDQAKPAQPAADDKAQKKVDGTPGEPTLSPLLRHAARRSGLEDADIDEFYAQAPELAEKAFTKLHGHFSDLSAKYAQIGQIQAAIPQNQNNDRYTPAPPPASTEPPTNGAALFSPEKREAMVEEYGDKILDDLGPLFKQHEAMVRNEQARAAVDQENQQRELYKTVDAYFAGLGDDLVNVYGNGTGDQATSAQRFARGEMFQLADQIRAGAASQGVALGVEDAMERASILHAHEHLAEITRKRLTNNVVQRSARSTIRPTHRGKPPANAPKSLEAAEDALEKRATELGVDFGH